MEVLVVVLVLVLEGSMLTSAGMVVARKAEVGEGEKETGSKLGSHMSIIFWEVCFG